MSAATRVAKLAVPAAALVLLALTITCQPQPAVPSADVEAMKALAERALPIWNEGNLDLIDELYAPECVRHEVDIAGDAVGVDALKGYVTAVREAFPDFLVTNDEVLVAGDRMVTRWTVSGTHLGTYQGQPPTGKSFSHSGVTISRVADGRTVEELVYYNALSPWQQVGYTLVPPAHETAE